MGAQIAAHLANAGVPVHLLDLDTKTASDGFKRAQQLTPDPFFTREGPRSFRSAGSIPISGVSRSATGSSRRSSSGSTSNGS